MVLNEYFDWKSYSKGILFVTINWNKGAMNHLKEKKVKKKSFVFIDNPWLPLLLRANFNERFRLGLNVKLNNTRAFQENGPQTFITNPTQWKLIKKRHIKEVDFFLALTPWFKLEHDKMTLWNTETKGQAPRGEPLNRIYCVTNK